MQLLWHEAGGSRKDALAVTLGSWMIPLPTIPIIVAVAACIWISYASLSPKFIAAGMLPLLLSLCVRSDESAIFIRGIGFQQVRGRSSYRALLEDEDIEDLCINEIVTQTEVCFYPCLLTRMGVELVPAFRYFRPNLIISSILIQNGAEILGRNCVARVHHQR